MSTFAQIVKKSNNALKESKNNVNVIAINEAPVINESNFPMLDSKVARKQDSIVVTKQDSIVTKQDSIVVTKQDSIVTEHHESVTSQQLDFDTTEPRKLKLNEAQYKKKVEKKASKKAEKEALEKEITDKIEEEKKLASEYAQKAYDEEYTIAWIEESKPENAIKRAQKAYDKSFNAKLDSIRKPKGKIVSVPVITDVTDAYLLEDTEIDEELPPIEEKHFTGKKIIEVLHLNEEIDNEGFQVVKKKNSNFKQNQFAMKLESNKNEYVNSILSEQLLQSIESNFKNNQSMVITLKTTDDTLETGDDYTITKSGFLKNKLFSKFLSRVIFKKLNKLKLYVDIQKINDDSYNLRLTDKISKDI